MTIKAEAVVLDEIRTASTLGYAKNVSIVDKLLDAAWCTENDLLLAYQDLQRPGQDRVIIFFQLPFSVRLADKWFRLKAHYGNPYIRFRSTKRSAEMEAVSVVPSKGRSTQVLVSYQLWERRRQLYVPYLEALESSQSSVATRLKSRGVLNAETFELDVAKRLLLETAKVLLPALISIYKVESKDPSAYAPDYLNNFFMMVKTGRLVIKELGKNNIGQQSEPDRSLEYAKNSRALEKRIESARPASIYETYLLEAARQIEFGSTNLAIVQTVMVLDWFANEMIQEHLLTRISNSLKQLPQIRELTLERIWESKSKKRSKIMVRTEDKFTKYLPAIGISLSPTLVQGLTKVLDLRNDIVHRVQVNQAQTDSAREALETGLAVIQHCMDCLLTRRDNVQLHVAD